ncbi:hypothetical protein Tco_0839303 [Tanacetum coccineum]|uniref:Uncharacterized protein n=1 Tax=Tanacetum coccineum TaxID=301880 RepID=A0ABQ5ARB1_9ASTR
MVYQLTKFHVQRVDMVINPPWNLPFLGAKGLTSPEQTATGKGISNPLMAVMVCQKPYGIQLTNVSSTERVNTPGSDENRLKLYDLMYIIVNNSNSYLRDILGDILGKDMHYPLIRIIDLTFNIKAFDLDKSIERCQVVEHGMDDHVPDEIDGVKCEQLPNYVVNKGNLKVLVCKQVANHGGDELVDKGRQLKRKV